ncbi:two-pore potassium channel 3-like [Vigna unguiculata]|uniref:two-pore potassium channel 3-like n=1 Tax=Vigna unguiculata TaxID=3917 RepID=UPI001016CC02|nr:two-pore potassium channel 3-like [Vigna unguiculata]
MESPIFFTPPCSPLPMQECSPPSPMQSSSTFRANSASSRKILRRTRSAPCLLFAQTQVDEPSEPPQMSPIFIIRKSLISLYMYMLVGVVVYIHSGSLKGTNTHPYVDAAYFTMVTLCTVGYGDMVPNSNYIRIFTSVFILLGFANIGFLLNGLVAHICNSQEKFWLKVLHKTRYTKIIRRYIADEEGGGRMRTRTKVFLALTVITSCIAVGAVALHLLEDLSWEDSIYLSVTTVTTVGYGDFSMKTVGGRCFAIIWLLVSTLAVAKAFTYFTEYNIEERNRNMEKWILHKKLRLSDLLSADLDNDGSIRMPEFVLYKLKQMGKITQSDIQQIRKEFDSLGHGKITLSDLMRNV